jgi:hypothetical protein
MRGSAFTSITNRGLGVEGAYTGKWMHLLRRYISPFARKMSMHCPCFLLTSQCNMESPLQACSLLCIYLLRLLVLTTEHHLLGPPLRFTPPPGAPSLTQAEPAHLHDACKSVCVCVHARAAQHSNHTTE